MTICRLDAHSYAHSSAIAPPVLQAVWRASLYRSATISVCCPSTISGCVKMLPFEKELRIHASPSLSPSMATRHRPRLPCLSAPSQLRYARPSIATPYARFQPHKRKRNVSRILGGFTARSGHPRPSAASIGAASWSPRFRVAGASRRPEQRPSRPTVYFEWPPGRVKVIDFQNAWSAASMAAARGAILGTRRRNAAASVPRFPLPTQCRLSAWFRRSVDRWVG